MPLKTMRGIWRFKEVLARPLSPYSFARKFVCGAGEGVSGGGAADACTHATPSR